METELHTYTGSTISDASQVARTASIQNPTSRRMWTQYSSRTRAQSILQQGTERRRQDGSVQNDNASHYFLWLWYLGEQQKGYKALEQFQLRCLRKFMNIHWTNFVYNAEMLSRAGRESFEHLITKSKLETACVHLTTKRRDTRMPCIQDCTCRMGCGLGCHNRASPTVSFEHWIRINGKNQNQVMDRFMDIVISHQKIKTVT